MDTDCYKFLPGELPFTAPGTVPLRGLLLYCTVVLLGAETDDRSVMWNTHEKHFVFNTNKWWLISKHEICLNEIEFANKINLILFNAICKIAMVGEARNR